ncbi:hypothetical protein [uncultured Pseudokineococcus sp.]|uniref:hypothetical protein n=1 Tax=uncultured Pseudokineococcus sp. TaxID=1642928 RepID=UPI00262E61D9|nr:hypothetical protein [uncultured Pseudokineococcus sp.]
MSPPPPTGRPRPPSPQRRLALAAGALAAGLVALVVIARADGRPSLAGVVLVGVGLVSGVPALADLRRSRRR